MVLLSFAGFSQTVNVVPISEMDATYVQIVGKGKFLQTDITINIQFGQKNKIWTNKEMKLVDKDGKELKFNSMMDALNFMDGFGYEYLDAYVLTLNGANVYHYVLKKTLNN